MNICFGKYSPYRYLETACPLTLWPVALSMYRAMLKGPRTSRLRARESSSFPNLLYGLFLLLVPTQTSSPLPTNLLLSEQKPLTCLIDLFEPRAGSAVATYNQSSRTPRSSVAPAWVPWGVVAEEALPADVRSLLPSILATPCVLDARGPVSMVFLLS